MRKSIIYIMLFLMGLFSCNAPGVKIDKVIVREIDDNWEFRKHGETNYYPAVVPGCVHTDLIANNLIEDPYYRLNERDLQWIDKAEWDYRTVFSADSAILNHQKIELEFEGLDTYARVILNEKEILEADNMFRTWTVDVSGIIKEGKNELVVIFQSPTLTGLHKLHEFGFQLAADNDQSETGEMGPDRVSPYVRKAPYHFGWDWGPRLVTSGIWRPVLLRAWSAGRIEDVNIVTEKLSEDIAELSVNVEVEISQAGRYNFDVSRDGVPWDEVPFMLSTGPNIVKIPVHIKNPEFWQPNDMGNQTLYTFKVGLSKEGMQLDDKEVTTGLRTVRLIQNPDPEGPGKSFCFEVNGKPVFAKGANYIPNDVFLNRVIPEKYEFIVKSAADAHMNMLRVWGGGVYENDLFYDLCDKYGIMVWQDFMFACAMYPGNDEFLESVRLEAIDNVRRLRNHPCLVLWCGNNEIEAAWGPYDENRGWGWKQRYDAGQREIIWKAYDTLFHKILPAVVHQYDPARPYWHSSPSAGMGQLASYETTSGDMHYWGVWHGLHPFSDFRKYKARFMSEYGFQSFPEFNSVRKYTLPEDHSIESPVMMAHQRSGIGNLRIRQYMEADYHIPTDFEEFLYVGQLLQAEAIKLAIESHRAAMPYCMGSLYWQINDCWPVASWSGIDYYGKWKALHYFVKEAFKPDALVTAEEGDSIKIILVSGQMETGNWKVEIRLLDFTGKSLWENVSKIEMESREFTLPLKEILANHDPSSCVLVSRLIKGNEIIDTDLHYFVKPKDLRLIDPQIKTEITERAGNFEIKLSSSYLAKNVFLFANGLEEQFSDNFFDLLPGESVSVSILNNDNTKEKLKDLKLVHLNKTLD